MTSVASALELGLVHNPVRRALLRRTLALVESPGAPATYRDVVEIGCGDGAVGAALIAMQRPRSYAGCDLDEAVIQRARRRLRRWEPAVALRLWRCDAGELDLPAGTCDLVLVLDVLHHVREWQGALGRMHDALRPGGALLFEVLCREYYRDTPVIGPVARTLLNRDWAAVFDYPAFRAGLAEAGFRLLRSHRHPLPGWHYGLAVRS
jgi:SAM-dependent methyltransferase